MTPPDMLVNRLLCECNFFRIHPPVSPKTVDNLGKTVDNLTQMWITSNAYSIFTRAESTAHPHIWWVHMFQTQITKMKGRSAKDARPHTFFIPFYPQTYSKATTDQNQKMRPYYKPKTCMYGKSAFPGGLSTYPQPLLLTTKTYTFYKRVKNSILVFPQCFQYNFLIKIVYFINEN